MPRTPSLSRATAEQMIGHPSNIVINSDTVALLRKWATACGIRSVVAYAMPAVDLVNMYHENYQSGNPVAPAPAPAAAPIPTDAATDFAKALRALIGVVPVDENKVREIVADALASAEPKTVITKLEIDINGILAGSITGRVHPITGDVIRLATIGQNIMLVGPAGCGKTTIGYQVATALQLPFYITSTVFDTHELLGFVDGNGNYHRTAFRDAFENGGVWVADELDAWDAAALLAANSALANGFCTFPDNGKPVTKHENFRVIATANTFGHGADRVYVGRNELDAASLDRFAVFGMDYDAALESEYARGNIEWLDRVLSVRSQVRAKGIRHVVSSRAIIMGVQGLSAGLSMELADDLYIFKGMSKADRSKIIV